ncbi:hypothetical protein P4O66_003250 [Electrophorus voltai]|uniref:Ig-like domain-containing protein n=1 Tax=Electrophorus voltai TaxID=2609070 RepID=A0AAD9DM42_9TELE|nr:hypothetical protein P4O66_003250 [Electrophorus voltai]
MKCSDQIQVLQISHPPFTWESGFTTAVNVICPVKRYVVILFQPVTLRCDYTTTATVAPLITWKYKSFCRDPIQAALNPSSIENTLVQANPNYNPNIECADNTRTISIVASKQTSVTLGNNYQGRKISIINNADLNIAQTAWGDSGVYVCSVASSQDLSGNGEDYTELIVLVYEAGKAVKAGLASQYAPTIYASSTYGQPVYALGMQTPTPPIPLLPITQSGAGHAPNGFSRDMDALSSVGHGSQVPLLLDHEGAPTQTRSGYRIQANQDGNPTRVLYYMERELGNLDPSRPGDSAGKYTRLESVSEISSLHDPADVRNRVRARPPQLNTVYDDENMSTISSVSQHRYRDDPRRGGGPGGYRSRTRSMEDLEDVGRRYRDDECSARDRGPRRGSESEWSNGTREYGRDFDDRRRRDYSPDDRGRVGPSDPRGPGLQGRRTRSREDLIELNRERDRERSRAGSRGAYDDTLLLEAMERKRLGEQQRARSQERLDTTADNSERLRGAHGGVPMLPLTRPVGNPDRLPASPLPYADDTGSLPSSKKTNLRKFKKQKVVAGQ